MRRFMNIDINIINLAPVQRIRTLCTLHRAPQTNRELPTFEVYESKTSAASLMELN